MPALFRTLMIASVATLGIASTPAMATTLKFAASLTGQAETPPNPSKATGKATVSFDTDTKKLSWKITYHGLTGKATAAHFHGPAAIGVKAPPVVPIQGKLASPIKGTATLTDQQAADLEAGKWYFNVHSAQYPDGEIRGQVTEAKP